jgi:hypothetical protein
MVAGHDVKRVVRNELARREENDGPNAGDNSDGQREHQQADLRFQTLAA